MFNVLYKLTFICLWVLIAYVSIVIYLKFKYFIIITYTVQKELVTRNNRWWKEYMLLKIRWCVSIETGYNILKLTEGIQLSFWVVKKSQDAIHGTCILQSKDYVYYENTSYLRHIFKMSVMGNALEKEDDQKGTHLPITALAEATQKAKAAVCFRNRPER